VCHPGIAPQEDHSRGKQHDHADADAEDGGGRVRTASAMATPRIITDGSSSNKKGPFRESRPIEESLPRQEKKQSLGQGDGFAKAPQAQDQCCQAAPRDNGIAN